MTHTSAEPVQLFVQERDPAGESLRVTPLCLPSEGDLEAGRPLFIEIPETDEAASTPSLVTASCGAQLFVSRNSALEHHAPFQDEASVEIVSVGSITPTSLLAIGPRCFVGSRGRIDAVDFSAEHPEPELVFQPPDEPARQKTVDAFALAGERLIAIDDEISPKFAFVFDLEKDGTASLCYAAGLPGYSNETVRQAAASPAKLALRTTFSHRGGAGQRLLLFDIGPEKLAVTAQAMEIRGTGMLKFGHSRMAGMTHSNWQGLGILGDTVLIGAAERGILVCPTSMRDEDRAARFDPGGACQDLQVRGERAFALVTTGKGKKRKTSLVVLRVDPGQGALEQTARHLLEGHPGRFSG